ncbi:hypothetical protein ABTH92_21090, partial [Acinetobacter baumannii]
GVAAGLAGRAGPGRYGGPWAGQPDAGRAGVVGAAGLVRVCARCDQSAPVAQRRGLCGTQGAVVCEVSFQSSGRVGEVQT